MKIKFNWGTGIVVAFALFMTFILYFVVEVQSNSKYDNDLVVEEYYKHDARFGEDMQRSQNAQNLEDKPKFTVSTDGIVISFPASFVPNKSKVIVSLDRPSNKKLDFETPISISESTLLIPNKSLIGGRWDIIMEWQYDGIAYLSKETIYIH